MATIRHLRDTQAPIPDPELLDAFWRAVVCPGDLHEVRIPKSRKGPLRFFGVVSGYFDTPIDFVDALEGIGGEDAEGVYITLNPVNPALLARAVNRLQDGKPITTSDADIVSRRHLLIDVDPGQPAGISATDAERAGALAKRDEIAAYLAGDAGWSPPVATMETGNGGALLYRVRLPNDPDATALVERVLKGLAAAFDGDGARVDTAVANAARIGKIAGTVSAKGDNVPDRPWRLATATFAEKPMPVPPAQLESVAVMAPAPAASRPSGATAFAGGALDVREALRRVGVGWAEKPKAWGTVLELDRCLTSGDHADGACVIEFASGAVAYKCLHARCAGKHWPEARASLGLGAPGSSGPRLVVGGAGQGATGARIPRPKGPEDEAFNQAVAATFTPAPESAFFGWFGAYADMMAPTSEAPPAFHLGAGLTLACAMIGRRVRTRYASDLLYANIYTVLIGPSGSSRKDTAMKRALALSHPALGSHLINPSFYVARDVSSAEGMIQVLKDNPNTMIYLTELSGMMNNAQRKSTSTITDRLIEAWDTPSVLQNLNKLTPATAVNPYLSIMAATQPGRLATAMTDDHIHSGFANRWLYVCGAGKPPMSRPPAFDEADAWALYRDLHNAIDSYPDGTVIGWDGSADKRWDDWYYATTGAMGRDEDEDAMRVRHATIIQKVALVYAVSERAPAIGDRHIAPAIALVEWTWSHVKTLMRTWGAGVDLRIEERVLTILRQQGPITRRYIQRYTSSRKWSSKDFAHVFRAMAENGTIATNEDGLVFLVDG